MRFRTSCSCGSEFEVRGAGGDTMRLWNIWLAFHQFHHGIQTFKENEHGKVIVTPLPAHHPEEGT